MTSAESTATVLVLALECPNRVGIVHAVSGFLAERSCDIVDSQQFDGSAGERFFMRLAFTAPNETDVDELRNEFEEVADALEMKWSLAPQTQRVRTVIMVSHADHCLAELIDQWRNRLANIDIVAVAGNHETLRPLAEREGIPFIFIPVTRDTKSEAESRLLELVERTEAELVVLARYMQILSDDLCRALRGRAINIHHSFLPGFKGARPYHQAHERGVKMVGATAHYVTADLDEGPIIAQSVFPVDHRAAPSDLAAAGRRAERAALAQAVAWHTERRIFTDGVRTVVFD